MNDAPPKSDLIESDSLDRLDMERLASGNDAALNALMDRHGGKLYNYLIRALGNEEDAADLAQETFVRVYQNRSRFDLKQKFTTWLFAIASNMVKDRFRWRARHAQISIDAEFTDSESTLSDYLPASDLSPSDTAQGDERSETIRRAVAELPEELRVPLILSEYEQKSHAEIAEILGCSSKAIETRIYRARQRLRKDLASLIEP